MFTGKELEELIGLYSGNCNFKKLVLRNEGNGYMQLAASYPNTNISELAQNVFITSMADAISA